LHQRGEAVRRRLGEEAGTSELAPGLDRFATEAAFGAIWARPGLAEADRMICTLAVLCQLQRLAQLRRYVGAALGIGIQPRAVQEIFVQCGLYGGLPVAENALEVAAEVFREKNIGIEEETWPTVSLEELHAQGLDLLQRLHGERGREGYAAPGNQATEALYRVAIEYGYGELWSRPGIEHRGRMLIALASFTVLRLDVTLRKFAQSALNLGLTRDEVVEAIMQTAPYGGFPVALGALASVGEVL
jgi:4-carboxymuconolactone decarboxylase